MTLKPFKVFVTEEMNCDHSKAAAYHEAEYQKYSILSQQHVASSKAHTEKAEAASLLGNKNRLDVFTKRSSDDSLNSEQAKKVATAHKQLADTHRTLVGMSDKTKSAQDAGQTGAEGDKGGKNDAANKKKVVKEALALIEHLEAEITANI